MTRPRFHTDKQQHHNHSHNMYDETLTVSDETYQRKIFLYHTTLYNVKLYFKFFVLSSASG